MKLGVCYYPEHWPRERWEIDANLMRKAGLSLVRIADFAWAAIEHKEGEFTWDWLDQAIEVLVAEDLEVILCTPTASPPPWMCRAYPDILPVDVQGRRRRAGSRRHYCPSNDAYHRHTVRIVDAMGSRYGKHAGVVGWQIDNEFGCHDSTRCYCEICAISFRNWLKAKYETINALNDAWGTIFWSQIYNDWNEIDPPNLTIAEPNPSHVLDYYRFSSDTYVNYQNLQISTLKRYISERQFITTNFMSKFSDLDYFDLAKSLDLVTMSSYPTGHAESRSSLYIPSSVPPTFAYDVGDPYVTSLEYALMRGYKSQLPFWVMEQQCGNVNWSKYNTGIRTGTIRLWTWHALASGAEAVLYFRWRAGLFAQEQLHSGLIHHDATPDVGYADVESMLIDRELMSEISSAPHESQIAFLFDYDALWAIRLQPHQYDFDYMRLLFVYYRALQRLGIPADIVSIDSDLSSYKMVVVPTAYIATEQLTKSLRSFVEAGGVILVGVRSGFKTINNQVIDRPLPGIFGELVGITVREWHSLPPGIGYDFQSNIAGLDGPATIWAEALIPESYIKQADNPSPKVLAYYSSGPFNSFAALTEYKLEAGRAFYLGWHPTDLQAEALLTYLTSQAGVSSIATLPEGMIVSKRGSYYILLNFTEQPHMADVQGRKVSIRPRNVEIIHLQD